MTNEERSKLIAEARSSLTRIQEFDAKSIERSEELGRGLSFAAGVEPLQRIVALFQEVSADVLDGLSVQRLNIVKQQADALFSVLQQILNFSTTDGNPRQTRDNLIKQLVDGYDTYFEQLWPTIAYSIRRATDFSRMEREARAAIQSIEDRTTEIEASLKKRETEAESALEAIRRVAAEQGVSQQAIYFKTESELHAREAERWLWWTGVLTIVLALFAASTLVLHKISWLRPANTAEAVQFGIGKMLVFATAAYFLILSARNYMAHRHNAIVNKHRQNSLVTYRALVEAAGDQGNRDIILTKAADSIFGPQSTGFTRHDAEDGKAMSMLNIGASALKPTGGGPG